MGMQHVHRELCLEAVRAAVIEAADTPRSLKDCVCLLPEHDARLGEEKRRKEELCQGGRDAAERATCAERWAGELDGEFVWAG